MHKVAELQHSESHSQPLIVLDHGRCYQACIHSIAEYLEKVDDAPTGLGGGPQPIRDHIQGQGAPENMAVCTKIVAGPSTISDLLDPQYSHIPLGLFSDQIIVMLAGIRPHLQLSSRSN